jgi:hypothetical protein
LNQCELCGRVIPRRRLECPFCAGDWVAQECQMPSLGESRQQEPTWLGTVLPIVYAPIAVLLMMWWGFGGFAIIFPQWQNAIFIQMCFYYAIELTLTQGLLFKATESTRTGAILWFLSPWILVNLITIPQIFHDPRGVLLMVVVPVLGFVIHVLVELAFESFRRREFMR